MRIKPTYDAEPRAQQAACWRSTTEKVEMGLKSHLKFLEEAGTDMQLLSAQAAPHTRRCITNTAWGIVNSYSPGLQQPYCAAGQDVSRQV